MLDFATIKRVIQSFRAQRCRALNTWIWHPKDRSGLSWLVSGNFRGGSAAWHQCRSATLMKLSALLSLWSGKSEIMNKLPIPQLSLRNPAHAWLCSKKTERIQTLRVRPDQEPATTCQNASSKMCGHNLTGYISPTVVANTFLNLVGFTRICWNITVFNQPSNSEHVDPLPHIPLQ